MNIFFCEGIFQTMKVDNQLLWPSPSVLKKLKLTFQVQPHELYVNLKMCIHIVHHPNFETQGTD